MPAPTAASDEYVSPKRRRSHRPEPNTSADATPPQATRASGPIQPRLTASTKKKTTPRSVTTPPAQASAFGPSRAPKSISRGGACGAGGAGGGAAGRGGGGAGRGARTTTGAGVGAAVGIVRVR